MIDWHLVQLNVQLDKMLVDFRYVIKAANLIAIVSSSVFSESLCFLCFFVFNLDWKQPWRGWSNCVIEFERRFAKFSLKVNEIFFKQLLYKNVFRFEMIMTNHS